MLVVSRIIRAYVENIPCDSQIGLDARNKILTLNYTRLGSTEESKKLGAIGEGRIIEMPLFATYVTRFQSVQKPKSQEFGS